MLKGTNVKIYGDVEYGRNVILEDNVVIGHPSAKETRALNDKMSEFDSLDSYYSECVRAKTYIGANSVIRSGSVIYSGVSLGDNFQCGNYTIIRENTTVGYNTYCKGFTQIMKFVKIGDNCRIAGVIADYAEIKDYVTSFGTITHRYHKRPENIELFNELTPEKAAVVEHDCIIGRGATLLGAIVVGHNSKIGANALVNFDVDPYSLIVGNKAYLKKKLKFKQFREVKTHENKF